MTDRIYLYDSTLRDGAQMRGIDFTLGDKIAIAERLDAFGIDYIEGGWPGANPADDQFFGSPPALKRAKLAAFGMTRRAGRSAANDPGLAAVLDANTPSVCLVGKAWGAQAEKTLGVGKEENLRMVGESIAYAVGKNRELLFDAEHFFDGYKEDPAYAVSVAKAAYEAGGRWVVLCDTNGGSLPHEIEAIVKAVAKEIPGTHLGVHCHNDTEQAVANSIAAVRGGVRQVQGTINGIGERCGNANLIAILPTLMLKMGFDTGIEKEKLKELTALSRFLDDRLNRASNPHAAYVGSAAFAHKGGLHVSAMAKDSSSYEHVAPELLGNRRTILVSDKAGKSNVLDRLQAIGIAAPDDEALQRLIAELKTRESEGYSYEGADASFELLARRTLAKGSTKDVPDFFEVKSFRVLDERRWNAKGKLVTLSEATIKLRVGAEEVMTVAEGNGPVNALDAGIRKALVGHYPSLRNMQLTDYKVRILTPGAGTAALTRVQIESMDAQESMTGKSERWVTMGVSPNVIDASFNALYDSITYKLLRSNKG